MRAWNRAKLLWGFLRGRHKLNALPVEHIVETTAKCNLYCPMCPRETIPQPKEDMSDGVFNRLVDETARSAEHMMLIGLGEPLLDAKIVERIRRCADRGVSTLLSTNGTLLDEAASRRLLDSPLEQITFSFDGATPESFDHYRKGARFDKVRDNFISFARLKKQLGSGMQIVVQMVRLDGNASETTEFARFWRKVPGVDQVRVKEDETNLLKPEPVRAGLDLKYPCHYLWRGPLYVKYNGDVYPCCQSYMLGGKTLGRIGESSLSEIWNSPAMQKMRRKHASGRGAEIDICSRCCAPAPHPLLVAGSLLLHGRTVRRLLPLIERLVYYSGFLGRMLKPARPVNASPSELVQIGSPKRQE